jgi:selenide,water dikinase
LEALLKDAGFNNPIEDGIVTRIDEKYSLVRNIDIFTPLVDDGYVQGKIAACNVTNDIFANNVRTIQGVLAFLGVPTDMPMEIARDILKGMDDFARGIGTRVLGGHTIHNQWPIAGGEAAGIEETVKLVHKRGMKPGDVLILTKPLGTQPLLAAYRVLADQDDVLSELDEDAIRKGIAQAITVMTTSNKSVVEAIHSCNPIPVRAMSDVTGFGLWGTLKQIAEQSESVAAIIDTIVALPQAFAVANVFGYNIEQGKSAETAGGMVMAVKPDQVEMLQDALAKHRVPHWRVGRVEKTSGQSEVRLAKHVELVTSEYTGTQ